MFLSMNTHRAAIVGISWGFSTPVWSSRRGESCLFKSSRYALYSILRHNWFPFESFRDCIDEKKDENCDWRHTTSVYMSSSQTWILLEGSRQATFCYLRRRRCWASWWIRVTRILWKTLIFNDDSKTHKPRRLIDPLNYHIAINNFQLIKCTILC